MTRVLAIALVGLFGTGAMAAQVESSAVLDPPEHLRRGADTSGAYGVVRALEDVLLERPELAASPASARVLALWAARASQGLPEADADHYLALEILVASYAPPERRAEVAEAVRRACDQVVAAGAAEAALPKLEIGSFRAFPGLEVTPFYDDNLFATPREEEDDWGAVVSPFLALESRWSRHALDLEAGADLGRFAQNTDEDYRDFRFAADGRYDLPARSSLFGGVSFAREHEERGSPDDVNGQEPTTYDDLGAYAGGLYRHGAFSLRLGGTLQDLDFDDVPALGGEIDNDDRDRRLYTGGTQLGYAVRPWLELFARGAADLRRYDRRLDDAGFARDSDGSRFALGAELRPTPATSLELFAGHLRQDYDDPRFDTVSEIDFGLLFRWRYATWSTLRLFADQTLEETTLPGASSYLSRRVGAALEHQLGSRWSVRSAFTVLENDYQGLARTDEVYVASASLRYRITQTFYVEPEYRFVHRDSTDPFERYYRNQFFLRFGAELPRRPLLPPLLLVQRGPDGAPAGEAGFAPVSFSGPYLGAQVGLGAALTELSGPRRMGTSTLVADFGDHGPTAGLFAGWGERMGPVYLGLEVEGEEGEADWEHDSDPGVRFFSVEKDHSYGASARLGVVLREAALLYVRGGAVRTRFQTRYQRGAADVLQEDSETGVRYGLGMEIPVTAGGVFTRLDHIFTDYGTYDLDYGETDVFENRETLTRLGIGYRFDGLFRPAAPAPDAAAVVDFGGAYLGGQVGHGALATALDGPREGEEGALAADFAGHGVSGGLFAGYGLGLGRWYLGLEAEASASGLRWDHTRTTSGRDFHVREKASYGLGLRVGHTLHGPTLAYLRAGPVRTRFETTYVRAPVRVDPAETLNGLRWGGGLEVAASPNVFVRVEYTYTSQGRFEVEYGSGSDAFDSDESLFRLGVGVRF